MGVATSVGLVLAVLVVGACACFDAWNKYEIAQHEPKWPEVVRPHWRLTTEEANACDTAAAALAQELASRRRRMQGGR